MSDVAYDIEDLGATRRGVSVLSGVTMQVRHGRVLALVGPNGAGKSSLLAALSGERPPAAGHVLLDGRPMSLWRPKDLSRQRSVLLQSNEVSFPFSVREVIEMGRSPWRGRATAEEDEQAIAAAIAQADIGHLIERSFNALSGGEKARVSLARVLAQDTPVVLLDEPTAALDLRHQESVMAVARDLAARGRAVVVVLHDLSLAAAWADEIAVLDRGRLVAHGTPPEVVTEQQISQTYGIDVEVIANPSDGRLLIVPHHHKDADVTSDRSDSVSPSPPGRESSSHQQTGSTHDDR